MTWPVLAGITDYLDDWRGIGAAIVTLVTVLASLPKVGKPVRGFFMAVLCSLPPVAEYRIQRALQVAKSEIESRKIEEALKNRYIDELKGTTEEIARHTGTIKRLTEEIRHLRTENDELLAAIAEDHSLRDLLDGRATSSPATSPTPRKRPSRRTSRATRS